MFLGKHKFALYILILMLSLVLISCGPEDYPYIESVPQSNVVQQFNDRARVQLPATNTQFFRNYIIFYRIYVSDISIPSTTTLTFSTINQTLFLNHNNFRSHIDSDTLVNFNLDQLFSARNYKYLELENFNIDTVLNTSAFGSVLEFDFTPGKAPTMQVSGGPVYTLLRSRGNGAFDPIPSDRYFIHRDELWREENINPRMNADVENNNNMGGGRRYTYAAMYIAAIGINDTYSYIYSTPSLIHVFLLPDP